MLKRLVEFLRSVIPADPTQLIFLAGVVSLFVAPHLRWWPTGLGVAPQRVADSFGQTVESLGVLFVVPIIFATVAGYFVCFWPGNHPICRILGLICFPAIAGMCLMFGRIVYLSGPSSSILQGTRSLVVSKINWACALPWKSLTGFHFCLIGLLLIATYTSRLAFGIAALPLSLPGTAASTAADLESWKRMQLLIWVLVGPLCFLYSFLAFLAIGLPMILSMPVLAYIQSIWFSRFSDVAAAAVVFAVIFWIAGREGRQVIWKTVRFPKPEYACLALAIPIGIGVLLSIGQYLFDRAQWMAESLGTLDSPQFGSYFTFPDLWLLLLVFPAFFEEMIFRGFLQHRFIQRYGIYRGIFLVGIVWAAFHFFSDFSFVRVTDQAVILKLASRILTCLVLSYVFGWLALRTGSILPASLAHTIYNVLVFSEFGQPFPGKSTLQVSLWGVLACVLFRYWPARTENGPETTPEVGNPEPAV
jgi:membrane protease YdiL (CAAX protease family)